MKIPDGFIFRISIVKKGTAIRIEESDDLICCKSCSHAYEVLGRKGTELCCSWWENKTESGKRIKVDPEGFCNNAKGDE